MNHGDPAHPRIEVDYQVFVDQATAMTNTEKIQSACSMDVSAIPTWCLGAPSLSGTTEVQLKSRYGTWLVPIPNKLSAKELCFGPKPAQ